MQIDYSCGTALDSLRIGQATSFSSFPTQGTEWVELLSKNKGDYNINTIKQSGHLYG
jgi:hypothetical protein